MGVFSFLCDKCGKPINSDAIRGQRCSLYLLDDGKVIQKLNGEYDAYGRVFDEEGKSIKWDMPWTYVCDLMFSSNGASGICAVHERCETDSFVPMVESESDPNQGWNRFRKPNPPFKKVK